MQRGLGRGAASVHRVHVAAAAASPGVKMRPRALALVTVVGAALLVAGCKDEGTERFRSARARYQSLLENGVPPGDPAFDEVLVKLEEVKEGSDARPQAQELARAIRAARTLPTRPLAVASGEPADAGTTAAECERLAKALGMA